MWKNPRLRPIFASVLVFALVRGALAADLESGDSYCSPYNYAGSVTFSVTNYVGAVITNFPAYVKISEDLIPGFKYADVKNGTDDLVFFSSLGKVLAYELEGEWTAAGENHLWLKLPYLRNGETVTMCWNLRDGCTRPAQKDPATIWSDYVGVWHMDEEITAGIAATTVSEDATGHGLDGKPSCKEYAGTLQGNLAQMVSTPGVFGYGRVNATENKSWGNHLEVPSYDSFELGGVFTISAWIRFDELTKYPQLFCRKEKTTEGNGWHVENQGGGLSLTIRGDGGNYPNATIKTFDVNPTTDKEFHHLTFVFNGTTVSVYRNGVLQGSGTINAASDNGLPLAIGCGHFGEWRNDNAYPSVNGAYDEVRLSKGIRSAELISLDYNIATNNNLWAYGAVTNDANAVLKNEWTDEPSVAKTTWEEGTYPTMADFDLGTPGHGTAVIAFYNKTTGESLGTNVPKGIGEYRAVITVGESRDVGARWGELERTIDFRIVRNGGQRDFGINIDRILLMNDDYTVTGGEVEWQSYNDEDDGSASHPYWKHLDADGNDASTTYEAYWSDSPSFNLGGGTHHVYCYQGKTLWDLVGVRVGNTFNNGEDLEDRGLDSEKDAEGLNVEQNYLPWNPDSQRVVYGSGDEVGPYHRYAGQIVMQNTLDARVTSSMYTNGIGTVYFDAVNGWTDNVYGADGAPNYQLVVEIATNTDYSAEAPRDELVNSVVVNNLYDADGNVTGRVSVVRSYAEYANWQQVPVRVLYFDGDDCEDLGLRDTLVLDVDKGGSYKRFYRAIVPVNVRKNVRVRIRRAAIDPERSLSPDGLAYVLIDNVICSTPADRVNLAPYGRYDETKTGKRVLGCEAAFTTAFPSAGDSVSGRAKATMENGGTVRPESISSATMHYRWHYLDQKTTGWKLADLDPSTLTTREPLDVPSAEGDIEFWFDLNQTGNYYEYADYSGTGKGLGHTGYSEAITSVTNRAPSYAAKGYDWFVRLREGKSNYAEMKLLVKTEEDGPVSEYDLYITPENLWSGYYRMSKAIEGGIWWRVEPRDRQEDGAKTWETSTNRWYVAEWSDTLPEFPAAGRMAEGGTNSWSRMACDAQTGYLQFQVDETTLGVTVIHADYQNFNDWNDAAKGYFTGSYTETNKMSGTSADVRHYGLDYSTWDETPATDDNWSLKFTGKIDDKDHPGYKTFLRKDQYFSAWDLGKGMWVYGGYRDPDTGVAFQMAGSGEGYVEFSDKTILGENWPRGFESVSFHARIAQPISPELMAYSEDGARLTNYTFMARTCFDMKQNKGFTGNAALSLFAYFRDKKGAYEARWEQIEGEIETTEPYEGLPKEPTKNGQRLLISRWNWTGSSYEETVLIATTNSAKWKVAMPVMPYATGDTMTNNLMPFCISAYQTVKGGPTYITAAVRIKDGDATKTRTGATAGEDIPTYAPGESTTDATWYFVTFKDESKDRLDRGSFGALSSNCEGMFVRPQYRAQPTWPGNYLKPDEVVKNNNLSKQRAVTATTLPAFSDCRDDIEDDYWVTNDGRELPYFGAGSDYGFVYVEPHQTIDVYTKSFDSGADWELLKQVELTGFGAPGRQPDQWPCFYHAADSAIRLQAGGGYDDPRVDVVISDIVQRQWRGYDSSVNQETGDPMPVSYRHTNFVFTTGWVTNGAAQLSAKRTEVGTPCAIRSPLFDGDYGNGVGLGMFGFTYREPQKNVRLFVQIATNVTGTTQMDSLTANPNEGEKKDGNQSWLTVAKLGYKELWEDIERTNDGGTKTWEIAFGYHGAKGLMRVIVDPALVEELSDTSKTDPSAFGAIDITSVICEDEPALDKGCWWGWNLQTGGDATDSQCRMFLPDCTAGLTTHGRWLALNNSITDGTDPADKNFSEHMPFVQSPTFTNSLIGQVTFKARKYDLSDRSPGAKVVIYGTEKSPDSAPKDSDWTYVTDFDITNGLYTTYTFKTDSAKFRALRLAVVNVAGTQNPPEQPETTAAPQRVLIDEVTVSEAVRAMLAFRNVGAFRHHLELDDNTEVPGVTTRDEQPLCGENWGIQAEVFATMLGDEIDKSFTPIVRLHWYVGTDRWGYDSWKGVATDNRKRGNAELKQTDGSNYVYRASYPAAPDAIMAAQNTPGTVVQYMLEVEYQTVNTTKGTTTYPRATNWLDTAAWTVPEWFAPVDYNNDSSVNPNGDFAAFTILDNVAPGWAWINEVNFYGTKTSTGGNSDKSFQYVEICAPMEADLTGWRVRLLEAGVYNNTVTTNWVAKFGSGAWTHLPGMKRGNLGTAERKVFHLIGNKESDSMKKSDGTLDGIWEFSAPPSSTFRVDSGMYYVYDMEVPFGVQLVRPTGVIESSIVTVGTNRFGRLPGYREYDPTNIVAKLNQNVPGSRFFYAGEDSGGTFRSVSVTDSQGEDSSVWTNSWACSPGRINTNFTGQVQNINPDHPTPLGDAIILYASVDTSFGHISQRIGGAGSSLTNASEMVILRKGNANGTNIVYTIDPWYELACVRTNGVDQWQYVKHTRQYEAKGVGKNASNNVEVVATAQIDSTLSDYLESGDPYNSAILDWLAGGKTLKWGDFANNGEIVLADYVNEAGKVVTNLSLKTMYWLDMDPTISNQIFQAYVSDPAAPHIDWPIAYHEDGTPYWGSSAVTNIRMSVFMMISNKTHGAWAPYVLRGCEPGALSWDYEPKSSGNWTSETFKVTGILANGLTYEDNAEYWIPIRWFVFDENSFKTDFTTDIEILDPHVVTPPGAEAWSKWFNDPDHPERAKTPVFYRWSIDERNKPVEVEVLKQENFY